MRCECFENVFTDCVDCHRLTGANTANCVVYVTSTVPNMTASELADASEISIFMANQMN